MGPEWWAKLREGLADLPAPPGGSCVVRLPGHLTLLKEWVPEKAIGSTRQLRESLPGDPDQLEWDARVSSGEKIPVRLAAGYRTQLEELVSLLRSAGWTPQALVPAGLPGWLPASARPELILNVGAASTLIHLDCDDGSEGISRRVSLAGNALTTALAGRLGITFDEAEFRKRECQLPDLGFAIRDWAEQMKFEIRRTRVFHLGDSNGTNPPRSVALTGGGARVAGIAVALGDALETVVGQLDVPGLIAPDSTFPAGEEDRLLDLIAGDGPADGGRSLNLLPRSERRRQRNRLRQLRLIASLALLAAAPVPLIGAEHLRLRHLDSVGRQLESWLSPRRDWDRALIDLELRAAERSGEIADLQVIEARTTAWLRLFGRLEAGFASSVPGWLTRLSGSGEGPLELELTGMLHPVAGDERAGQRSIESLMRILGEVTGAGTIQDESFELTPIGTVRFSCSLKLPLMAGDQ